MEDLNVIPAPVFVAALIATLVPFITALLVRYSASSAVKANVATAITVFEAAVVVWVNANDVGVPVNIRTLILAVVTALTAQRVTYSQVVKPNRIPEKLLPEVGLRGGR